MAQSVALTVKVVNGQVLPAAVTKYAMVNNIQTVEVVAGIFGDATLVSRVLVENENGVDQIEYYCTNTALSINNAANAPLA